jgi:hypothetical protein
LDEIKSGMHLQQEIASGAKFVVYQYCISILIMTFRRSSDIYLVSASESRALKGLGFSLLSFFLGWWGIPWGPIYTIQSLWTNFNGGKDVTQEVLASMAKAANKV